MASTNPTAPPLSDPFKTGPNKAGCIPLPIHALTTTSSSNYTDAQTKAESLTSTSPIRIRDGRRNSQGEILPSPTESWKPTINRVQSWNREEFKRVVYRTEMQNGEKGQGTGFTEGGEGTRKV